LEESEFSDRESERRRAQDFYRHKKKQQYEIWGDYRTSPLKELYYNLLLQGQSLDLLSALSPKREITDEFLDHIEYIVTHDKNLVSFIVDETGEGKSLAAIGIVLILENFFLKYKQITSNHHFTFNLDATLKKIPLIKNCDIIEQDEDPNMMGTGSRNTVNSTTNVMEEMRSTQKCVIMCSPSFRFISGITMVFHLMGKYEKYFETKNPDDMKTRLVIRYMPPASQGDLEQTYLGWIEIPLADAYKVYVDEYLPLKRANYAHVESSIGIVNSESRDDFLEGVGKKLADMAASKGWNGKSQAQLNAYIGFLKDESGKKIDLTTEEVKKLIVLAANQYNVEKKAKTAEKIVSSSQNNEDFGEVYNFDYTKAVEALSKDESNVWENKERDIEIFIKTEFDGIEGAKMAKKFGMDGTNVSKIKKSIRGKLSEIWGHKFEPAKGDQLKKSKIYDDVIVMGGGGDPDIVCMKKDALHVYSCKSTVSDTDSKNLGKDEFNPEITYCLENKSRFKEVLCFVAFYHLIKKKEIIRQLDFEKPEKRYNFDFT
jgi:hypothetical protein